MNTLDLAMLMHMAQEKVLQLKPHLEQHAHRHHLQLPVKENGVWGRFLISTGSLQNLETNIVEGFLQG